MPDHTSVNGGACDASSADLQALLAEDLEPARERTLRLHLSGCPGCREALLALDPGAIFLLELGPAPLPAEHWRGFDAALRARIEAEAPGGRRGFAAAWIASLTWPRPALLAAPAAMLMVLAMSLMIGRPGLFGPAARGHRPEGIPDPYGQVGSARRPAPGRDGLPTAVALKAGEVRQAIDPPVLEEVVSPAARVYQLEPATGDSIPVYLVVDENINF